MPIFHPPEPEGGKEALTDGLSKLLRTSSGVAGYRFLAKGPAQIAHGQPHRVYTVALNDLARGRLLKSAKEIAWSYPVFADSNPIGEMEIETTGTPAFRAFHKTPFTKEAADALDQAETSPSVARDNYEVRFLKIPPVYFAGVWLHATSDDIIVPLREPPGRLESNKEYRETDVIKALQPVAKRALGFQEEFGGADNLSPSR